ncbi:glycosyltransferase family 4 protein [Micromonospora sp. WMMA1923]|uniref:glycosyltransferase family 4 protein n=1 Tax=Micromonospora sp. WMMA1923 TaxID=3404125 RepID=UPI003B93A547
MFLFVLQCPTPHHTPLFDRLHAEWPGRVHVYYRFDREEQTRGWGDQRPRHPYTVLTNPSGRRALLRSLSAPTLEVVCLFGYRGWAHILSALTARVRRIPLIVRCDSNVRAELARPPLRRWLKRHYLRGLLGQPEIWAVGSANAAYWRLLGFDRLQLVPFALPELPRGAEQAAALRVGWELTDRFVFGYVGRLEELKGVTDLLAAFDLVRNRLPAGSVGLVLVGTGSLTASVTAHVARRPADCRFLGPVAHDRLGAVYAAADVVVVPSRWEPWGLVVNEALGLGTPVVASDEVAAADDLVAAGNGRRFPAGDVGGLAEAMLAEYRLGARRLPRLVAADTAGMMARRLRHLVSEEAPADAPV